MSKIILEIPYQWEWLLYHQLKRSIQKDWEESLMMAALIPFDDVYYANKIDQTADIMLQLVNQNKF